MDVPKANIDYKEKKSWKVFEYRKLRRLNPANDWKLEETIFRNNNMELIVPKK